MLKITSLFLFSLLIVNFSFTQCFQNYVPNPSFESANSNVCDFLQSQLQFTYVMDDWFPPTQGTADVLSTEAYGGCALSCISNNQYRNGSQLPRTGNWMAGIMAYETTVRYREYISVKLNLPLQIGQMYYVEMYVSLGDDVKYACNNLGFGFSMEAIDVNHYTELSTVDVAVKSDSIITNSIGWVKIGGEFVATEEYEYLIIGNFYSNFQTSVAVVNNFATGNNVDQSYYFIDDVALYKKTKLKLPEDACVCVDDVLQIKPNGIALSETDYTWQDGSMSEYYNVTSSGTYTVEPTEETKKCYIGDTTEITVMDCFEDLQNAYIPNVFTPNGDGINDFFEAEIFGDTLCKVSWNLEIYNRWGVRVYEKMNYDNSFGNIGNKLSDGIYYYSICRNFSGIEKEKCVKGWFKLNR